MIDLKWTPGWSSIDRYAQSLKILDPFIGHLALNMVHQGTLEKFIQHRRKLGRKSNTVNRELAVVRRILNLSARLWRDEQNRLFKELPEHLRDMAIFKVNTGAREQEVTCLRWEWEVSIPELKTSLFLLPGDGVKNGEDRLIVLNSQARAVINRRRGKHEEYVFTYAGLPVDRINTKAWRRARKVVGLPQVRVHDLKHTFGRRLRARGVSHETRQVLLGHKNGRITTHYSAVELEELIDAVERVSWVGKSAPTLTLLKSPELDGSRKTPAVGRRKKACNRLTTASL